MTTAKYKLITGQLLSVTTRTYQGTTGSISEVTLEFGGLRTQLAHIKSLMKPEDANDLEEYLCEIAESNRNTEIAFSN